MIIVNGFLLINVSIPPFCLSILRYTSAFLAFINRQVLPLAIKKLHSISKLACFLHGKEQEIREFGATTCELLELAAWLSDVGCHIAAMESTASYWKSLYNVLEVSEIPVIVVNAKDMKNVPGRKTDVQDAEWIMPRQQQ